MIIKIAVYTKVSALSRLRTLRHQDRRAPAYQQASPMGDTATTRT
jgi:hypothetical protein